MRIGFYAPLKAPDHPVPSGDRQMARALMAALWQAGHGVELISRLRSFARTPDAPSMAELAAEAAREASRLSELWADAARRPDLLFTYHPYYKAPDLIGPPLARRFGLPYATAEASLAVRRADGPWAERQALVADAVREAALNVCFTERDRAGLLDVATPASLLVLPPFIDGTAFGPPRAQRTAGPVRLVTVAMMRPGDKLDSYRFLARALASLTPLDCRLSIVGDGPARPEVEAAFARWPADRIDWVGALPSRDVADRLREADLLVWPGLNEAFGVCYLEAQASGLPVVAVRNAGTPSVIRHGETGLLTEPHPDAFAAAVTRLFVEPDLRARLAAAAFAFAQGERGLPNAAQRLDAALRGCMTG